jgi:hypothetical protein
MSKHSTNAALTLCGIGLCMIGIANLAQLATPAQAAVAPSAAAAIASAASAQAGPTVVWYGTYGGLYGSFVGGALLRAWSDGTVEMKKISYFSTSSVDACNGTAPCSSPWLVISSPTAGYRAAADINADELVNGVDLASILGNWGDAPRVPFPPSDCPLNLVNP